MDNKRGKQPRGERRVDAASLRSVTAGDLRAVTSSELREAAPDEAADAGHDEAALRGEVLPLGNSVLEDIQGTFG